MRRFFCLLLLLSTLLLSSGSYAIGHVQAQSQNNYALEIQGTTWNRNTLNVLLIPPVNDSWWNAGFLNATLRAIGQWNDAITYFASNYTQYSYLSALRLQATVADQAETGFDIYINWTQSPLANTSNEIGLETSESADNVLINANISLAADTSHGNPLNDVDMQNTALHELGHTLGLGHTNDSSDTMYPSYTLLSPPRFVSTFDAYGVATVFAWMQNSFSFYPVNQWLQNTLVTLPADIPYKSLPVTPQNAAPQTIANNPIIETLVLTGQILIHPDFLAIVIVFAVVLVIIAVFPSKRKREQSPKAAS